MAQSPLALKSKEKLRHFGANAQSPIWRSPDPENYNPAAFYKHRSFQLGRSNLRASLRKRYAHLKGERDDLLIRIERTKRDAAKLPVMEAELPELEKLLETSVMLLTDNDPDWKPDHTPPIKPWAHHIPVPFGQCGRRGLKVLREAERPMTVRLVSKEVL